MNPPSPIALENAIRKKISENPALVGDSEGFEEICQAYFSRSSSVKAMKAYLSGHEACPYILGCLIYSSEGAKEICTWVDAGMPTAFLYRSMLHDGGRWREQNPGLKVSDLILNGDERWDLDYKLLLEASYPESITSGLIHLIVQRALARGQMKEMISVLPQSRLIVLVTRFPDAFSSILENLNLPSDIAADAFCRKMSTHWLGAEESIMKMLQCA